MSLFSPLALLWLLPIVGGLLLLYFLRPKRQQQEVPSLFLWSAAAQNSRADQPFQKLKFTLLLLLQLLALLALLVAYAHPFTHPLPTTSATYVIILDQSADSEATDVQPTRFAAEQASADHFIRQHMLPVDRALIVGSADAPTVLCPLTSDKTGLTRAIDQTSPGDTPTDMHQTVVYARSVLRGRPSGILIFSSGNWSQEIDSRILDHSSVPVQLIQFGAQNPTNAGIVGISERTDLTHPAAPPQLLVSIDRHNTSEGRLLVSVNGKEIGSTDVPAGSGSLTELFNLPLTAAQSVATAKLVRMGSDNLAVDNTSSLIVSPAGRRRILLVTNGNPYLERALVLLPRVDLYEEKPSEYTGADQYTMVIFDQWLPQNLPDLPMFVINAVSPGLPVNSMGGSVSAPQIVDWDENDPLLDFVDLSNIHLSSAQNVRLSVGADDVADLAEGPAIARTGAGRQQIVWLGFALQDSDFPLQVGFPIFMTNVVNTLTSRSVGSADQQVTGSALVLPSFDGTWTVTDPAGMQTAVSCSASSPCSYRSTQLAGIYTAAAPGETLKFALNLGSPDETDLAPQSHPLLTVDQTTLSHRLLVRNNLLPLFAAFALLLIIAEWLVYQRSLRYTNAL